MTSTPKGFWPWKKWWLVSCATLIGFLLTIRLIDGRRVDPLTEAGNDLMQQMDNLYWYGPAKDSISDAMSTYYHEKGTLPRNVQELIASKGQTLTYRTFINRRPTVEILNLRDVSFRFLKYEDDYVIYKSTIRGVEGQIGVDGKFKENPMKR